MGCAYTSDIKVILNSQNLRKSEFSLGKEYIFCVNSKYLIKNKQKKGKSLLYCVYYPWGRKERVGASWGISFCHIFDLWIN